MKVNIGNWELFQIKNFFDIHPTKAYNGMSKEELDDGGLTPFVVNSAENNGIGGYSSLEATEKAGIITFSDTTDGNTFFYQPHDFIGFAHVQGMYPKSRTWTKNELLFLVTMLSFECFGRYNYGRKMTRENIASTFVLLPAKADGTPNWEYMNLFIKSLHHKTISTKNNNKDTLNLDVQSWEKFKIGKLFEVQLSKGDIKMDDMDEGAIPLVSSGETHNGIVGFIDTYGDGKAEIFKGNKITIDMFGNAFYQPDDFYAVSHGRVNILNPKFSLTKNIGLFIASVIKMEQYKYSYGRAVYSSVAADMEIMLPIQKNPNGTPFVDNEYTYSSIGYVPDWEWMDMYMKSLPYSDRI